MQITGEQVVEYLAKQALKRNGWYDFTNIVKTALLTAFDRSPTRWMAILIGLFSAQSNVLALSHHVPTSLMEAIETGETGTISRSSKHDNG